MDACVVRAHERAKVVKSVAIVAWAGEKQALRAFRGDVLFKTTEHRDIVRK